MVRPHHGGLRNHLDNLSRSWRQFGCNVKIVTPFGSSNTFPTRSQETKIISRMCRLFPFLTLFYYFVAQLILRNQVKKEFKNARYDVINVRDVAAFNALYRLAKNLHIPLIVNIHGVLTTDLLSKKLIVDNRILINYFKNEEIKCYKRARYIVCVGPQEKENVCNLVQKDSSSIPIIYNLVDTTLFRPLELLAVRDKFVILFVGRLSKRKGVDVLIEAFYLYLKDRKSDCELIIAGDGPEREKLEKKAREMGIIKKVSFLNHVEHSDLNLLYNKANVVIIPSKTYEHYTEGTPTVALEAMSAGRPIIATSLGGLKMIIQDMVNGLIIEENNAEVLAQALKSISADDQLAERLGNNGRIYCEKVRDRKIVAKAWLRIFERALKEEDIDESYGM